MAKPLAMLPAEGQLFAERYRIERCIAAGGMGAVYEVLHLETQRRRALKVMLPDTVASEELRERFKREARVAAGIESEHIVEVFDAGVDSGTGMPFLVMELLKGNDLSGVLESAGRLSPRDVLIYLRQIALALDKTHAAKIVHRDLKPENLFLTRRDDGSPRIKILDFGISKVVREGATKDNATRSLGTPLYMAPEQFLGGRVCPETDIFSLGMIAYTLLTGRAYWHEESEAAENVFVFASKTTAGPRELASQRAARLGCHLPAEFDAWFARVTARSSSDRFARATEAIESLGVALGLVVPSPHSVRVGSQNTSGTSPTAAFAQAITPASVSDVIGITGPATSSDERPSGPRTSSQARLAAVIALCAGLCVGAVGLGVVLLASHRPSHRSLATASETASAPAAWVSAITSASSAPDASPVARANDETASAASASASAKASAGPPKPPKAAHTTGPVTPPTATASQKPKPITPYVRD